MIVNFNGKNVNVGLDLGPDRTARTLQLAAVCTKVQPYNRLPL